jgi:NAD(P)-dependent dehydrogenase (short-subunit alcohol dehydrogenase family)
MDLLSRAMQLDGARVVSLAPGIIDTDMQQQLRAGDPSRFPDVGRFREFKASGALQSCEDTAQRLIAYAQRDDFGNEALADLRSL